MNQVAISILRRRSVEVILWGLAAMSSLGILGVFVAIVGISVYSGWQRFDLGFLVQESAQAGLAGGIGFQILGSMILIGSAAVIVTPVALALAISERTIPLRACKVLLRQILHIINATPSILFGIIGFVFFTQHLGWGKSWLAGGLILAIMILPTVTLSLIHRFETIPHHYIETSLGLGLTRNQVVRSILIPYGYGGLLTGLVMGLARAFGETAPIMFTAAVFSGATVPGHWRDSPVLALPYHIFNLIQDVIDDRALVSAWASASVLILLVVGMSLLLTPFRIRSHEEAKP